MTKTLLVETLSLPGDDELRVTFAEPDGAVRGGLVVLHEARGITPAVRLLITALAGEGWLTVAPHVYRNGAEELDHEQAAEMLGKISGEAVLGDAELALDWLSDRGIKPDLTGVIGFDLGGTVAFALATRRQVGAAVSVAGGGITRPMAGGLPALADAAAGLCCPWLGLYGDRDEAITVAEIDVLREAVDDAKAPTDLVRFPDADHRFDTDPDAAHEAWQRALNWFDAHLR